MLTDEEKYDLDNDDRVTYICPKCGSGNVRIQDDSFSHDWNGGGTEIIMYPVCNDCGYEDDDWEYEG